MKYLNLGISIILLIMLNWVVINIKFDGILGKIICLILLVFIANKNSLVGILGVALIISKHNTNVEQMEVNLSATEKKAEIADFKNSHCKKDKLYNGLNTQIMTKEIIGAFPNVVFEKDMCNLCDENCKFSLL